MCRPSCPSRPPAFNINTLGERALPSAPVRSRPRRGYDISRRLVARVASERLHRPRPRQKSFLFRGRVSFTGPPVYAWHLPEILTPLPQDVVVAPIHCQLQDVGIAHGEYDKAWMAARDHLRSQGFPPSVYGAFVLGGTQHG